MQIYESVMRDRDGRPTTGLLSAMGYAKDNRLLPRGFEKGTADPWIAVTGEALGDPDFSGKGDRVRYSIDVAGWQGPFRIEAALRFQVIGFRWAENLRSYRARRPHDSSVITNRWPLIPRRCSLARRPWCPDQPQGLGFAVDVVGLSWGGTGFAEGAAG